ncbi:MAG: hypothetical protein KBD21_02145 [Candidatus Pacebacteria bacterium]|nr:hypothetical protein [Candidatus Paceibacterota bacterium]
MTPRTNLVQDLAVKYQVTPEIIIANTNLHQVLIEMFVQGIIRARIADFSKSTDTETSTIECLLWSAIIKHARALFPEVNIDFEYQDLDQRQQ